MTNVWKKNAAKLLTMFVISNDFAINVMAVNFF